MMVENCHIGKQCAAVDKVIVSVTHYKCYKWKAYLQMDTASVPQGTAAYTEACFPLVHLRLIYNTVLN